MGITVEQLLAGPRGRRACLAFAMLAEQEASERLAEGSSDRSGADAPSGQVPPASFSDAAWDYRRVVELQQIPSSSVHFGFSIEPETGVDSGELADDEYVSRADQRRWEQAIRDSWATAEIPDPSTINELFLACQLPPVTEAALLRALRWSTTSALYWHRPDGLDQLCARPEMEPGLRRVAEHLASSPLTASWDAPFRPDEQWVVTDRQQPPPRLRGTAGALRAGAAQARAGEAAVAATRRPENPSDESQGDVWSFPAFGMTLSGGQWGDTPAQLWLAEEGLGAQEVLATPLRPLAGARVLEITDANGWAEVCAAHPIDVTRSYRGTWGVATGHDGEWVIPDLEALSKSWEAVHLSVAAYLQLAGTLVEVPGHGSTMLAGWHPDSTLWLTDPVAREGATRLWLESGTDWVPAAGPLPDDGGETSAF